jgi:hypothetical protein
MATEGQRSITKAHAESVVGDFDEPYPSRFNLHVDTPRLSVEGIFNQLLHH